MDMHTFNIIVAYLTMVPVCQTINEFEMFPTDALESKAQTSEEHTETQEIFKHNHVVLGDRLITNTNTTMPSFLDAMLQNAKPWFNNPIGLHKENTEDYSDSINSSQDLDATNTTVPSFHDDMLQNAKPLFNNPIGLHKEDTEDYSDPIKSSQDLDATNTTMPSFLDDMLQNAKPWFDNPIGLHKEDIEDYSDPIKSSQDLYATNTTMPSFLDDMLQNAKPWFNNPIGLHKEDTEDYSDPIHSSPDLKATNTTMPSFLDDMLQNAKPWFNNPIGSHKEDTEDYSDPINSSPDLDAPVLRMFKENLTLFNGNFHSIEKPTADFKMQTNYENAQKMQEDKLNNFLGSVLQNRTFANGLSHTVGIGKEGNEDIEILLKFLVPYTTCPVYHEWDDLGMDYWPRYLMQGRCIINPEVSCSIPAGLMCKPKDSYWVHMLKWFCKKIQNAKWKGPFDNETTNHVKCDWILLNYPVLASCECSV